MRALLDVNVLVALLDAAHLHHRIATAWLAKNVAQGWASCPLTQNGCLRILSLPGYRNAQAPAAIAARLAQAAANRSHRFWPDSFSILESARVDWNHVLTSRQITDVYLLALAVANGGRLVTLDQAIERRAVAGASARHLVVLGREAAKP
jgi:toxin-antitoxin system PIN domain toxin